jgi:hypothetical protein
MADGIDPATMDALNALGDEIAADAGNATDTAQTLNARAPQSEPVETEDAAHEPQEGEETASEDTTAEGEQGDGENEGEQPAGRKPARAVGADKRIKELTREKYEARNKAEAAAAEAAELRRQLEEMRARHAAHDPQAQPTGQPAAQPVVQRQGETGQDFNARVQAEAQRLNSEAAFNAACNRVAAKGAETHKDFAEAQSALVGAFGRQINARQEFLQAITRLENGHDVFHHLGSNLQEAETVFASANPVDLVLAIKDLSAKLKTPKAQKVSNAPAPVTPIRGGGGNRAGARIEDEKISDDDFKKLLFQSMAS